MTPHYAGEWANFYLAIDTIVQRDNVLRWPLDEQSNVITQKDIMNLAMTPVAYLSLSRDLL